MGWSIGYDDNWQRDVGYGVPAICDEPDCATAIDRGLSYVCGGEPFGGERGCGLFFCSDHLPLGGLCQRCADGGEPYKPKPDVPRWLKHKLRDASWWRWRNEHPDEVSRIRETLRAAAEVSGV